MAETLTLPVQGMSCSGCENAVIRAVASMPGVSNVTASHQDAQVVITYDPALVAPADIGQKIGRLGYAVGA
ncbi:MAG TPA: cation transporter [Vicinamibacterales bacterium]|nr:cation transporter [Vicinamibacterales bacterium]